MAAQPPFALHPADAIPGVIDLTTREGIKLYQNATWSFYSDPTDCFNCEAPVLYAFLKEVEGRASRFGLREAILKIPNDITNPQGGTKNLLTHYGELSLEHLCAWETTYLHGICRAAQDMAHLHLCLMNSLTQTGKDKVCIWSDQFILDRRESGILLLRNYNENLNGPQRPCNIRIRIHKRRRRDKVRNHNVPNGWPIMRNTKLDNFHEPGSGTETNGIGAPKKQELNVSDAGTVTPPPPPPPPPP